MQIKEKLIELRKQLPHGSIKIISDKTGIRQNTVIDILHGRTQPRFETLQKIVPEINKILQEQERMKELLGIEKQLK